MAEVLAALLPVLVQNLMDRANKVISTIRDVDEDAAKLTKSLVRTQKFLNDAAIPGKEEAVKNWLTELENVGFDADNVLDEINYHLMSKKIMSTVKPQKLKVLQSCFSCFTHHIAFPRKMGLRIKQINEELESINKEAANYGLSERLAAHVPTSTVVETDCFAVDPIFVGRDDVVSEIVEMLDSIRSKGVPSIIAVVGMGGLGKTTLIREVFNHQKAVSQFGSCIWVHVSQIFDQVVLFKKILKEVTSQQIDVESRQGILNELQKALKDKTYLLVLDDNWNDKPTEWEDFIKSLLGVSSKGNAIVVTTRSENVASIVNPLRTHKLEGLSEEDCWSIIKGKTYGEEDVPSELESIGRNIARKCQGLPLAASVVGGVLCNKSVEEWLSIEEKWLSCGDRDSITKNLRLSFDYLSPPSLKKCFAYCSIFPKGHKIVKQELVEYWMAEGFLEDDGSVDMESLGNKYVNILLHNSLLQVAKGDEYGDVRNEYGDVQLCEMHDHVHDFACSVLGTSSRVRYMIHEDESSPIPEEVAKHLRTLFFKGEISSTVFSDMESLHVLTCSDCDGELPSSIRKLIHLRTLDVSYSSIRELPEWIGELHNLQTLRASNAGYLRKLPNTLKYLINLRHLYLDVHVELPAGIGRLASLQTLLYFPVGDGNNGCKIEELGSLNNLKGELSISNLEKVGDKEEAEKANLCQKSKLLELCLYWGSDRSDGINDKNVLEGLQPHPNLKKLAIVGFMEKRFPMWIEKMAVRNVAGNSWVGLNKLISITLSFYKECEELPMMGHLPNLKSLYLSLISDIKCIRSSFYGLVNKDTHIVFPALERLELRSMSELAEWAEVEFDGATEVKVFPRLQHLKIFSCEKLMNVPTPRCQTEFSLLTELCLVNLKQLESLHDWLFYNNPNLSRLEIRSCLKLRKLPDGVCTLNSLKELIVWDCPNLERIASDPSGREQSQESFTSLRRIEIRECDVLVCLPCEMVQSSLESLTLTGLSSLNDLPNLIACLPKSPRLTYLCIEGVPQFTAYLAMDVTPGRIDDIDAYGPQFLGRPGSSSMDFVDCILQRYCHSLTSLLLKGLGSWECPESIQHLTALDTLHLVNFGMEELPEWFGNLSSLNQLYLVDCKNLRRLPSVDAMGRITTLQELTIIGCPELRIQSDDGDSEWPKVSHIPIIKVFATRDEANDRPITPCKESSCWGGFGRPKRGCL